ncbi:hypothetical protein Lser_V15G36143 [Lactuca serriola]
METGFKRSTGLVVSSSSKSSSAAAPTTLCGVALHRLLHKHGCVVGIIILITSNWKSTHFLRLDEQLFFIYLLLPIIFNAGQEEKVFPKLFADYVVGSHWCFHINIDRRRWLQVGVSGILAQGFDNQRVS